MNLMTRKGATSREWQLAVLFSLISSQAILAMADDPSKPKEGSKSASPSNTGSSSGLKVFYVFIGLLFVALLAFFLYKQWQKKKREEQHARLLRLFEEDDELELELGLRD